MEDLKLYKLLAIIILVVVVGGYVLMLPFYVEQPDPPDVHYYVPGN